MELLPIRYLTINIDDKGVTELDDDQRGRLVFIPRGQVVRLRFGHGPLAERPFVEGLFGAALIIGGLWLTWEVAGNAKALVILELLGGYSLWRSVRRGRYMQVETHHGTRKILLRGDFDAAAANRYLDEARQQFGYQIDKTG